MKMPNLLIASKRVLVPGQPPQRNVPDYYLTEVHTLNLFRNASVRMNGYQLAFCLAGQVTMKVSGEEIHYRPGSFAVFSPFNTLEVYDASDDFRCTLLMFQKSFLTETLNNIYFLEQFHLLTNQGVFHLLLTEAEMDVAFAPIGNIRRLLGAQAHAFRQDIIRGEIIILLYELENMLSSRNASTGMDTKRRGKEKKLADFQELLVKHFYKERKVAFYATALNTSSAQLSKLLYETTGRTAKEHIDEVRLMQAKHLLKAGKYNISEVASLLSYTNLEEFSRFFKKKVGRSPLRYAKEG